MPDQDGARSERVRGIASTHLQKGHRRLHLIILIALAEHLGGDFTQCGRRRPALRDGPSAPFLLKYLSHSHCQRGDEQIFSNAIPVPGFEDSVQVVGLVFAVCGLFPIFS